MRWIAIATVLLLPALSSADQIRYVGGHPLVAGDDYCYIEVPHVHSYGPAKKQKVLYRKHGGQLHFVGDPVAHGYDGERHQYHGHHPVSASSYVHLDAPGDQEFFCYIDGPHFHAFAPAPGLRFEVAGDAYWYAGPVPKAYKRDRRRYRPMTRYYTGVTYDRPVITVEPPRAYVFAGPGVHAGVAAPAVRAEVHAPAVRAEVHLPSVEVVTPGVVVHGGVVVDGHHHHKHRKFKRRKHKHRKYKHRKHRRRYRH